MRADEFLSVLGADFYTGVPDSLLKALCDDLVRTYGTDSPHHVICANEGNCAALAAGYHLATGKIPVVYMQNSGEGNAVNPMASLLSEKVYGIPVIFVIGWRGEPGVHDEPQHALQGEITLKLMEDLGVATFVVEKTTSREALEQAMFCFRERLGRGQSVAFVVRKGAITGESGSAHANGFSMKREEIIRCILNVAGKDPVICTTGKASRELFELREANGQGHECDFLTVGSMGHASSVALGVAMNKPDARVWCIDGDGAALMHMGAMAVIGSVAPKNLIHVIINNGVHESVGGMPTAAGKIDLTGVARACGYPHAICVEDAGQLEAELRAAARRDALSLIKVKCAVGARADLGRPTTSAMENKRSFMAYLEEL